VAPFTPPVKPWGAADWLAQWPVSLMYRGETGANYIKMTYKRVGSPPPNITHDNVFHAGQPECA
jgi:hypothetical protein